MKKQLSSVLCLIALLACSLTAYAQVMNESQGTGAGSSLTTGDYNTIYGDSTAHNLSSGGNNTMIGTWAGYSQTTAWDNTFIGYQAGYTNTTGVDNTFIGKYAGHVNTATDNTFIGSESGYRNTSGSDNTFIGETSGYYNTTGRENVFIGEDAGYNNTDGDDNTFVGSSAGRTNTTGEKNAFFGNEAGYDNSTGWRNTAVGDSALIDVGSGHGNTGIGQAAGCATEHGDYNTFIGVRAGYDNNRTNATNNANRNTYVGTLAGGANRVGEDNVGMGAFADFGNSGPISGDWTDAPGSRTNTSRATFIGSNADAGNNDVTMVGYETRVDGQYGIAMGVYAQIDGATGGIGIGHLADLTNNADYSVAIGKDISIVEDHAVGIGRSVDIDNTQAVAIGANAVVQNDGAIVIGYGAQSQDLIDNTNGDPDATYNMAIGYNAITSGFNSIAIGNAATAANDNTMVLGGATNPLSVGIGTDTPNANAALELSGTNKGLLVNRLTTAQKTSLGGSLTAAENGMVVFDTDLKGLYVWDGTQWLSALADNLGDHTATTDVEMSTNYLDFGGTEGVGIRFWNGNNSYKMSMGNSTDYQFGPVTDYSIKTAMNSTAGRGWTWGVNGQTPIAAIDNTGKMQIANTMTIGAYTLPNTDGTASQVLSTDGSGAVTWVDATTNTDNQDLTLSGNTLALTNDASTVDLSGYLDNTDAQNLSLSGTTLNISNGTGVDLSSLQDGTGTDNQDLTLSGNTLSLTNDATSVDLSAYVNTDAQNLTSATLTGTTVQIDIQNGTSVSVDLAPLLADLENRVTLLEACDCNTLNAEDYTQGRMGPVLHQNIPNPFDGTSAIGYYLPHNSGKAHIVFSNGVGQIVRTVELAQRGDGEILVDAKDYSSGMYYYTLYIEGKKVATKKMIVE